MKIIANKIALLLVGLLISLHPLYSAPLTGIVNTTKIKCQGGSDGTATVVASGGSGTYTYLWFNPSNGLIGGNVVSIGSLTLGSNYRCRINDGITFFDAYFDITENPGLFFDNLTATNPLCNGGTGSIVITPIGGTAPYQYSVNGGVTFQGSNTFNVPVGSYDAILQDNLGCLAAYTSNPIVITAPSLITFTTTKINVDCFGGSTGSITVSASGGVSPYSYSSDNGGTYQTPSNIFGSLAAATYQIVVKDDNNCVTSATAVTITEPTVLSATLAKVNVTGCNGNTNGSITISSPTGGSGQYEYTINGGTAWVASGSFTSLGAGTYDVRIRDKNTPTCTKTLNAAYTITEPAKHTATISITNIPCPESGNVGAISFVGTSGGPSSNYDWSIDGSVWNLVSPNFTNKAAGNYNLFIRDGVNTTCITSMGVYTITKPSPLAFSTLTSANVTCNGNNDGTITAVASGGTAPYTYTLKLGGVTVGVPNATGIFTGLAPGATYTVTIKDNVIGCATLTSSNIVLTEPSVLSVTVTPNPASACVSVALALTANPVGGNGGNTYSWTAPAGGSFDNATSQTPNYTHNVTGAFSANVTVTDSKGCTASGSTNITINPTVGTPVFTLGATSTRCQGAGSVTYTATATNTTGITYTLDAASTAGGNTIVAGTGAVTYVAGWSGTTTITASAAGCNGPATATHTVTITPTVGTPVFTLGATSTRCQGAGSVTYTATATNTTGITYTLDAASTAGGNTIVAGTGAVTYAAGWSGTSTITASAAGCNGPKTSTHTVTTNPPVTVPVFTLGATSTRCQGAGSVTYTATATNTTGITYTLDAASTAGGNTIVAGTGAVTYVAGWSGTSTITASAAGCSGPTTATHTVTITPTVGTPVFTLGATSTRCQGAGSVTYTATATNTTGITYTLDAASTAGGNTIVAGTGAVTYVAGWSGTTTITASAAGCNGPATATHTVTITPTVGTPVFTLGATSTRCQGAGSVTYTATATNTTGITYTLDAASTAGGNTIVAGTGAVTYAAGWSGTSTITASAAGCNGPKTSTHTVTTNPPVTVPVFTLGATSTRCQGAGSVTYTATATNTTGITYTLDAASTAGGNTIVAGTGAVTYVAGWSGTSTITASAAGCSGPTTATHTVTITPTVGTPVFTLGATSTRCQGAGSVTYTATATNTTGITYTLDAASTAGGNTIVAGTGAVTYVAGWSGTTTITASAAGCNGPATATHTVTITPTVGTPVFTLGATSTRCQGAGSVTYTATATNTTGITYTLDAASTAGGNTIVATGAVTYAAGWSGTSTITASAAGCNGPKTSTHTVTTNPPVTVPVFTLGATSTRCQGAGSVTYTATATNTTGITYTLDAASTAGGNTIVAGTGAVTYVAGWSGTSTITASAAGCSGPTTATHTVTITPTVGTPVFTLGATSTRCQGAGSVTYTATATNTTGITYTLDAASTAGGNTIVAGTGAVTYVAGWSGTTTITASAAGCNGPATATHTVTINALPNNLFAVSDPTVCFYENATIAVSSSEVGVTYNLQNSINVVVAGPVVGTGAAINFILNANTIVVGSSNYTVLATSASGCNAVLTDIATVTKRPEVTFTYTKTDVTCNGLSDGTININAANGTAPYTVSIDNGLTYPYTTGVNINVAAGSYQVYVKDANNCLSAVQSVLINQPLALTVSFNGQTDALCNGSADGTVDIKASGGTAPYQYSIDGGLTYFPTNTFSGLAAGSYTALVKDFNNCTATAPFTISEPIVLSATTNVTDIVCYGASDGVIDITASGGTAPYQYSIDGGSTFFPTSTFNSLTAGTYNITVTDAHTCSFVTSATITEPLNYPLDNIIVTDIRCNGGNNGAIQMVPNLVDYPGPFQYSIDGGLNWTTNDTFTGLTKGVYTITYKSATGTCIYTDVAPIGEPAKIKVTSITKTDLLCNGGTDGTITITATSVNIINNPLNVQYAIDGGGFGVSGTFNGLTGGDHTISIQNDSLCIVDTVVHIVEPLPITMSAPVIVNPTCSSLANGSISVTASNGTAPYTYTLKKGVAVVQSNATGTFIGLISDNYTMEITDANGCMISNPITLSEPPLIVINPPVVTDPTCSTQGIIAITATGGTGTLTYTLNPGAISNTTGTFPNLAAGDYTISVTDANACGPMTSGTITVLPAALISIDNIISTPVTGCFGDANGSIIITASGGVGTLTYSIDGGATTQLSNTFLNVAGGDYTVVVNDDANCPKSQVVTIIQPAQLVIDSQTFTQITAAGANDGTITIVASGGTAPLLYTLQPVGTSNATGLFTSLTDGTYTVLVSDANGCSITSQTFVLSGISVTIFPHNVSCFGLSDGHIGVLPLGGTPPYTINCIQVLGSGNVTMPDTLNLPAGDYIIDLTDNAGQNVQTPVTITQPLQLTASFVTSFNPTCFSGTNGSVVFNISGGTLPYTITWSGGSSVGTTATDVSAGTYDFTITDAHGCSAFVNGIQLTDPPKLNITQITSVNPLCNGYTTGTITVTASGGTGVLSYSITGATSITNATGIFDSLPAGDYTVSVVDGNGCVGFSDVPLSVTLTEPTPILITANTPVQPLNCPNVPDGYVYLQISGGTPDYSYLWSNNQVSQDLVNVVSGDYNVTVTDANGCTAIKFVTVAGPPMLKVTDSLITEAKCSYQMEGIDVGSIEITGTSGGTGDISTFTYLWNYPANNPTTGKFIDNLSSGNYTVTITDDNGCKYDHTFNVPSDPNFYMLATVLKDTSICYGDSIKLVAETNGPLTRTYTYSWYIMPDISGVPNSTDSTYAVKPTSKTTYYLELRNDGGCFSKDTAVIDVYPKIDLSIPLYITAVQVIDTMKIISILSGSSYNMDVTAGSAAFPTLFSWEPSVLFDPSNSWNSSISFDDDKIAQIQDSKVELLDPQSHRMSTFYRIYAKATTSVGCKDSLRLYARLVDKISMGNVFTPNGDGINDVWRVPKDYLFPNLEIEIFNRWGALVWSAKGSKAVDGWNGRTNNGNELPIGTYYYVIKYNASTNDGKWKPVTGSITIVR